MAIEITKLDYPIAKESTTVLNIFNTLKVITKNEFKQAVKNGKVSIDGKPCDTVKAKLRDGQVLTYSDFEIKVILDETGKGQRLMTELVKNGGFRGNTYGGGFGSGLVTRR